MNIYWNDWQGVRHCHFFFQKGYLSPSLLAPSPLRSNSCRLHLIPLLLYGRWSTLSRRWYHFYSMS